MDYQIMLNKVEQYAKDSFDHTNLNNLLYHNLRHTESVASYARQIARHYQLGARDYFIVVASAWLHDLGYTLERANHEAEGAGAAAVFLGNLGLSGVDIDAIKGCILATKLPQDPHNLLEEIVCDADLYHLGTSHFSELNKMMRKETEEATNIKVSKDDWRVKTINFLESHTYHTEYAKLLLNDQKKKNLEELKEKSESKFQQDLRPKSSLAIAEPSDGATLHHEKHKKDKEKNERPERGIETMFRVSSSNHQRLSDMADNKAHIMITVNSIILSAVISLLLRKLDENSYLMIPTFMLLAASLITIIFSILATRPTIPNGIFSKKDIEDKKVNLLFFGNFYRMKLPDYKEGMEKMMADKDYLYGSLIMDGFAQGKVLGKKYQLLRISYNVFMFGLILSVIAFIIASAFYGK
ncbi:MAG TPA: Pycsar system effector family protein [Puia sp.]|nr:Pycsar system effector family protein [Puia sp.]